MKNYFLIIGIVFISLGCDKIDEKCVEEKFASAIVYEFPDSLYLSATHQLKIEYVIENSCGSFVEFEDTIVDNNTEVKIKTLYEGCNCTLEFLQEEKFYPLHQDSVGKYHYKFWMSETEFDEYTLTVFE